MHESMAKCQSYLLRLWQESPHALWHASAQCVQSRETLHFADLNDLVAFLWGQTVGGLPAAQRQNNQEENIAKE
jgi:hypothetical protein